MADQGRWFKLWCSSLADEGLDNLDIADFGRWAKLGAYVKEHGKEGVIALQSPARTLCSMMQLPSFEALLACVSKMPNVTVTGVTIATVTFCNWNKYQGDNSASRTRRWRESVTPKKRREERRGEKEESVPLPPDCRACESDPLPKPPEDSKPLTTLPSVVPQEQPTSPTAPVEPVPVPEFVRGCPLCLQLLKRLNDLTVRGYTLTAPGGPLLHDAHRRFGAEACEKLIDRKCRAWLHDRERNGFLALKVLFSAKNVEQWIFEDDGGKPKLVYPRV